MTRVILFHDWSPLASLWAYFRKRVLAACRTPMVYWPNRSIGLWRRAIEVVRIKETCTDKSCKRLIIRIICGLLIEKVMRKKVDLLLLKWLGIPSSSWIHDKYVQISWRTRASKVQFKTSRSQISMNSHYRRKICDDIHDQNILVLWRKLLHSIKLMDAP